MNTAFCLSPCEQMKQHASFVVEERKTDMGIRERLWNKDHVIVYFQQGSGWGQEHLQPGSLVACHSDWADTKPYSRAGIFVQLTFSRPVIMQCVCSLRTHCSQVAGMVTKNPTYFRIFLFANPRQCHQKKLLAPAEELKGLWGEPVSSSCVLLREGKVSSCAGTSTKGKLLPPTCFLHHLIPTDPLFRCFYNHSSSFSLYN